MRRTARDMLWQVLHQERSLADEFESGLGALNERDRALARMLTMTALRRYGQITDIIGRIYPKGLPERAGRLRETIIVAIAQLLFLDVPAHAAVDLAVRLVQEDRRARSYSGLANAGLRRIAREGAAMAAAQDEARLNTPRQLWQGWVAAYGEATARAIGRAHLHEAALDLSVKGDPARWAETLGATLLPTGTLRLAHRGRIDTLAGFAEGAWWVQDMAASLPVRLLANVAGKRVIDLCAAPGGKTAQLAAAGAIVTAVDKAPARTERLAANLARLRLDARLVSADALAWQPDEPADAVLLDAPCSATGTLRRHPDAAWTRGTSERDSLASLQQRLLERAVTMVRPGGHLVYCTCSLEPAEGEDQIARLLGAGAPLRLVPVEASEVGGLGELVTPQGYLRTLPSMLADAGPPGLDGFFAARLERL